MYVIICVVGGCSDYGPSKAWIFRSQEDCGILADKMLNAYRRDMEKKGQVFIDGKAFCLKFSEEKGV